MTPLAAACTSWRANKEIALRDWGEEEIVVFCDTTGDTHLLDANGSAILLALCAASGKLTSIEILSLVSEPSQADAEALLNSLEEALAELERRALVYRVFS